jgi:ferredoxin-NADP reductase
MTHTQPELLLRVADRRDEAVGVVSVVLEAADGRDLPVWTPGAHVDLHLPNGLVRQYSLCGDVDDRKRWRVAVLREEAGRGGSIFVHDLVVEGDELRASGPRNNFALEDATHYVFIAGGIGITPLLPMIAQVARVGGRDWRVAYGGRHRSGMAFVTELERLVPEPSRLALYPEDECGLIPLGEILGRPDHKTLVYCCGPLALMSAVRHATVDWGHGAVRFELFASADVDPSAAAVRDGDKPFDVVAERSGVSVTVQPAESIVQALERVGVSPITSCEEGICGTCETAVVRGAPDHRDHLLTDDEKAANTTMLICVGRSLSPQLVLDI